MQQGLQLLLSLLLCTMAHDLIDASAPFILVDVDNEIIVYGADTEIELLPVAQGYMEDTDMEHNLVIYERKAVLE